MNMKVMKTSPLDIMKKLNILDAKPREQEDKQLSIPEAKKVTETKSSANTIEINLNLTSKAQWNEEASNIHSEEKLAQKSRNHKTPNSAEDQTEILKKREAHEDEEVNESSEEEYEESETQKRMRMMGFPSKFISRRDLHKRVKS